MTDVTDELIAKLQARREHGTKKYGGTLQPFDGRNTERDIEEELLDALQYTTKMRMEREEVAALLERANDFVQDHDGFELAAELRSRAAELRADVWRVGGGE